MKYKGKKLEGRNTDVLVLTKGDERIVFKAQALVNYKDFDKICPLPEPPIRLLPGGVKKPNENDPNYKKAINEYNEKRVEYMILKTLEPTEDLEWETVDITKPETYNNWQKELEEAGFSEIERMRVLQLCIRVNALDDDMLEQAKESFLAEAPRQEK
jgi:hypothetical protein